ncbi:TonB-dependent receptor [Exilibacterium tricleocarpae]|uniref:TonB-dependent receptor n=1 Tax=Exilibacterium tricleocarpae TaxID=2591008 RepID=UPI001C5524AC|nr:TonB-dependent receptor [Exilibacterium tricleocarpae]
MSLDDSHTAQIDLSSERVDIRADYGDLLPGIAHARMRLSYTDYRHKEIDGDTVFSNYSNEVYDARLELTHKPLLGFTGTLGVQYTDGIFNGINYNDAHEGDPELGFVEPVDYETESYGLFLSERQSLGPVDLEIAFRKDWRDITIPTPQYNFSEAFLAILPIVEQQMGVKWIDFVTEDFHENNPDSKHNPFSASLGATWNFDEGYSAALTLARSERAPSVRELYAYGNNLATNSYELGLATAHRAHPSFGDPVTDVVETTKSIDLAFRKQSGSTLFEIGLFYQEVDDYIFARLIETENETGVPHNYLLYTMADAKLTGIDGQISYQFNEASRLTVFGDYVRADLAEEEDDNLPRTPPGRFGARYDWTQSAFSANLEYIRTFNQGRIASYETKTDGYGLINMTLSYGLSLGSEKSMNIYIRGTNLTNELAFVHTSFVKDQSPLRGRNIVFGVGYAF